MKTLNDIQVKTIETVPTTLLEVLKGTQDFCTSYFNELDLNVNETERRLKRLEKNFKVVKYTDGVNCLIAVNNKIWNGVSILTA